MASTTVSEDIPLKDVTMSSKGNFSIKRGKEKGFYELTFGNRQVPPACQCHSWQPSRLPCKHFFALFRHYPDWQWEQLSPIYLNGSRPTLDQAIIATPEFDNERPKVLVGDKEKRRRGNPKHSFR